jgi:DNA-binding NarL/FixJ family response regulator
MIFDRTVALVPLNPANTAAGAVEIEEPSVVEKLLAMFLREWQQAREIGHQGPRAVELSPRETAIVDLLAAGHTDVSAAHRLGVSTRTVSYALRRLMDRFGVDNRFQLGLALGVHGTPRITPRRSEPASDGVLGP